jgi:hypothetical protein
MRPLSYTSLSTHCPTSIQFFSGHTLRAHASRASPPSPQTPPHERKLCEAAGRYLARYLHFNTRTSCRRLHRWRATRSAGARAGRRGQREGRGERDRERGAGKDEGGEKFPDIHPSVCGSGGETPRITFFREYALLMWGSNDTCLHVCLSGSVCACRDS